MEADFYFLELITMSRTLILLSGFWFSSFMNDALMACFVKFATVLLLFSAVQSPPYGCSPRAGRM